MIINCHDGVCSHWNVIGLALVNVTGVKIYIFNMRFVTYRPMLLEGLSSDCYIVGLLG